MEEDIDTNLSKAKRVPAFDISKGLSEYPAPSNFLALVRPMNLQGYRLTEHSFRII